MTKCTFAELEAFAELGFTLVCARRQGEGVSIIKPNYTQISRKADYYFKTKKLSSQATLHLPLLRTRLILLRQRRKTLL
jgi:hypothetical protein